MIVDPSFHERYGRVAVVAGASEGIGRAFAHQLAEKGLDLILLARRIEPLEAEAHLLRRRHGVSVEAVAMDLGAPDLATKFAAAIEGKDVGLLVYNACFSKIGKFLDTDLDSKLATIDVNCRGPVVLSTIMAERLAARKRGGLLLMSSMSGLQGTAMVSTYAASKAFNTVLGEGLWAELSPIGVDVLVCVAGATSTPNFEAQTPESKRAQVFPMTPDDVARGALANLGNGPVHYAGPVNFAVATASRFFSRRAAVSFISKNTRKVYG
jgi:short-subunit dehydrogenase